LVQRAVVRRVGFVARVRCRHHCIRAPLRL
jgi:hypothetical protein